MVDFFQSLDPYRWIISYQKPATLSSTEGELKASFATDGNFRILYGADPRTNYSATLHERTPSLQIDLGKSVPVQTVQLNAPIFKGSKAQSRIIVRVGKYYQAIIMQYSTHQTIQTFKLYSINVILFKPLSILYTQYLLQREATLFRPTLKFERKQNYLFCDGGVIKCLFNSYKSKIVFIVQLYFITKSRRFKR